MTKVISFLIGSIALFSLGVISAKSLPFSGAQSDLTAQVAGIPSTSVVGNLIGYWNFDDIIIPSKETTYDLSNNGNYLIRKNSSAWTTTSGRSGVAYQLNGSSHYAQMVTANPANTKVLNTPSFTVSAWVKRTRPSVPSSGKFNPIVSRGVPQQKNGMFVMGYREDDSFTCAFYGNDLSTSSTYTGDTERWTLWTCTYDSATRSRRLYRNGALVASDIATSGYNNTNSLAPLNVGYYDAGSGQKFYFSGAIDDIRIYNKALSANEVTGYRNQCNFTPFNPISNYPSDL
jgi:hypothetical protein